MTNASVREPAPADDGKTFRGFPSSARATAVPNAFFAELLPLIDDVDELRVTLYAIYALGRHKGYPRFVTENELAADSPLNAALGDGESAVEPRARLHAALDAAVTRGSLLRLEVEDEASKGTQALYFINTPASARQIESIRHGEVGLGRALPAQTEPPTPRRENIFQIYESNIGPLTPLVAEELREAEQLYAHDWIEEALKEAALLNKRSWRYASAILRRWASEGRKRETAGRDPGEGNSARAQFLRRYRELGG